MLLRFENVISTELNLIQVKEILNSIDFIQEMLNYTLQHAAIMLVVTQNTELFLGHCGTLLTALERVPDHSATYRTNFSFLQMTRMKKNHTFTEGTSQVSLLLSKHLETSSHHLA